MREIGKNYDLDHRYRVEAEICGLIMTSNHHKEVIETIFDHNLSVTDFHYSIFKSIYEAILTCIERSAHPSVVNVGQFRPEVFRLNNYKDFEIQMIETMRMGIVAPVSLSHAMFILKQYVLMDFWNNNAHDVLYGNWNGRDVIEVGDNIIKEHKEIMNRMTDRLKESKKNDYSKEIREKVAKKLKGESVNVSTTVPVIDEFMTGYSPAELIIIAGRPGMGKTTFALISGWNTSKLGNPVLFFSLEMPENQLKSKIISLETGIDYKKIKEGDLTSEQLNEVERANRMIDKSEYFFIVDNVKYIEDIAKKTQEFVKKHGIKIVFIDYLQRCKSRENVQIRELITIISRECKSIAKDNYVPVIALSQLSRAVEARHNKRPMLQDLKESGSIEEDADIAAFLFRQAYYDLQKPGASVPYNELFHTEFIVAKGRDLGTTVLHIFLDAIKMRISEYSYFTNDNSANRLIRNQSAPLPPPPPLQQITIDIPEDDDNDVPF